MTTITSKVGKRGAYVIPAELRRQFGLEEGSVIVAESTSDGILLRPADSDLVEIYTPERIAQFLLTNAVDQQDYERARADVLELGLNPDEICHERPDS